MRRENGMLSPLTGIGRRRRLTQRLGVGMFTRYHLYCGGKGVPLLNETQPNPESHCQERH